jgi:hypothetical protein
VSHRYRISSVDLAGAVRLKQRPRTSERSARPPGAPNSTRSDIDVRIDGQKDIDTRGGFSNSVKAVGNDAGSVASATGLPSKPPVIQFRPGKPPEHIK